MITRDKLATKAKAMAMLPLHGYCNGEDSNIEPIIALFPKWNIIDADNLWCAAFVYYCCIETGYVFPYSPNECVSCSLAGCGGWEDFAINNKDIEYHNEKSYIPEPGDIVLFDNVFCNKEHDHIGIVLINLQNSIITAEGNINNTSAIIERKKDNHIRAYIKLPNDYVYH